MGMMGMMGGMGGRPCGNPNCYYLAHSDPSLCDGYCCQKCEGKMNNEEWAIGGKSHYSHCEKREPGAAAMTSRDSQVCGLPGCGMAVHSNPEECWGYCCQKCEGKHAGEEWAIGGKKHYKQCEGRYPGDPPGRKQWDEEGNEIGGGAVNKKVKQNQWAKQGGGGGGTLTKGSSTGKFKMKSFPADQKIWVQNIPDGVTSSALLEHFKEAGSAVLCDTSKGEIPGTQDAGVAFESAEDAVMAILQLNGSVVCGNPIIVVPWTEE